MIMKNWSIDARIDCPWEGQSIYEFLIEEVSIIDEKVTILDAVGYFIVDHELELKNMNVYEHSTLFFED